MARMTTLFLLRHAHAGDPEKFTGNDDLRPLSDKGHRQSERVGRLLASADEAPDLLVTSPRVRAEETARDVAAALGVGVKVDRRLAGALDADTVASIVTDSGAQRPCLVGHDPDFSEVLGELIGASVVPMRKGAIARLDFQGGIHAGRGQLRFLVPPELLPGK
jgi:phosphohistidine phosphatase SixA